MAGTQEPGDAWEEDSAVQCQALQALVRDPAFQAFALHASLAFLHACEEERPLLAIITGGATSRWAAKEVDVGREQLSIWCIPVADVHLHRNPEPAVLPRHGSFRRRWRCATVPQGRPQLGDRG